MFVFEIEVDEDVGDVARLGLGRVASPANHEDEAGSFVPLFDIFKRSERYARRFAYQRLNY
jgi:hypothetical protein